MKKILLTLQLIALTISAIAQTDTFYIKPYTEDFDSIHAPLLEDSIPYGRLYDRVFPWAGLDMAASDDTVSFATFKQGWYELELSRKNLLSVPPYASYRRLVDTFDIAGLNNRVFINAIAVKMAVIDTLAYTDGRLVSKPSGYDLDTTKSAPFISKNALMSGLSQYEFLTNTAYTFSVSDKYIYTNDRIDISSFQLLESINGINITKAPGSSGSITFSHEGKFDIQVKTNYSDQSTVINTQTIEVRNPPPDDPCKRQRHILASDIPFQGEGEAFGTTSLGAYFISNINNNFTLKAIKI